MDDPTVVSASQPNSAGCGPAPGEVPSSPPASPGCDADTTAGDGAAPTASTSGGSGSFRGDGAAPNQLFETTEMEFNQMVPKSPYDTDNG